MEISNIVLTTLSFIAVTPIIAAGGVINGLHKTWPGRVALCGIAVIAFWSVGILATLFKGMIAQAFVSIPIVGLLLGNGGVDVVATALTSLLPVSAIVYMIWHRKELLQRLRGVRKNGAQ